jgi:hypothetical protein
MFGNIDTISDKQIVLRKLITPSIFSILLIVLFTGFTFKYWINWEENQFVNDIDQYYSYLIAQFIHHDLTFHFPNKFWLMTTPTGEFVPRATIGIALLNTPFFILADNIAHLFGYETLGYSKPYAWCIHFSAICYILIGFYYSRKTLLLFFNEWITAMTLLCILFATNLFYYTFRESEMPHGYLFFLFSLFIYHVVKWHSLNKIKHFYIFCFVAGFIALIRPTEILVMLIPLLYNVVNFKTFTEKIVTFLQLKWKLVIALLLFLTPIIPQLIYWKIHTGQYLFFSYGNNEGFFFSDPQIYSVMLGWRKGWLIYSPLMIFSIIGLGIMFFKWKKLFFPIFLYLVINIYLISSWWDWGFGGAYGMRALVQSYAFLVIPLAFFFDYIFKISWNKLFKRFAISVLFLLIFTFASLNIYQTFLFKCFYLPWDSMTKEIYFYTLFNKNIDRNKLETMLVHPNYEEMRKGNRDE